MSSSSSWLAKWLVSNRQAASSRGCSVMSRASAAATSSGMTVLLVVAGFAGVPAFTVSRVDGEVFKANPFDADTADLPDLPFGLDVLGDAVSRGGCGVGFGGFFHGSPLS